jgi:hypothetical protein
VLEVDVPTKIGGEIGYDIRVLTLAAPSRSLRPVSRMSRSQKSTQPQGANPCNPEVMMRKFIAPLR